MTTHTATVPTHEVIRLARKHVDSGSMQSSARVCLADAINLANNGNLTDARQRAIRSLQYSVGGFHPDYVKAVQVVNS